MADEWERTWKEATVVLSMRYLVLLVFRESGGPRKTIGWPVTEPRFEPVL